MGGTERSLSASGDNTSFLEKRYVFIRIRAYLRYIEPEWGEPSTLHQNPGTISLFAKTAYLRYIEPEGWEPSPLHQNPGTISLFAKTLRLHSN